MNNDYQIFFEAHNQKHKIYIDLECFAKALKPYLVQPKEEKKCHCLCHVQGYHSNCSSCSFNHVPTAPEEKKECTKVEYICDLCHETFIKHIQFKLSAPTDEVEEKIKEIANKYQRYFYDLEKDHAFITMQRELRDMVELARKTK